MRASQCCSPWRLIAQKTGETPNFVDLNDEEVPDIEQLEKKLLSRKTKLVISHHVSNMLGSVMPINDIVAGSLDAGSKVLVDDCQSAPLMVVDVQKLDADFLVASSHKMCGPTGIGFLDGKSKILSAMPPYLGGGEMIADAYEDYSSFPEPPSRFEAGTPAIAEAIRLGAAIDYLSSIGMQKTHDHEVMCQNSESILSLAYEPKLADAKQRLHSLNWVCRYFDVPSFLCRTCLSLRYEI